MKPQYPYLSARVQSSFIDALVIIVLMFVFSAVLDKFEDPPDWIRIAMFFGIWAVYEPLCTTLGATIGNMVKGIRVRRRNDPSKRINFFQAFIRYIFKMLLGWVSFLTIHSNTERRAIHDIIAGSVVVNLDPGPAPDTAAA